MRTGITIDLNSADRARLEAIAADRNSPQKHVWRSRIVLLTANGIGTTEIMREAGVAKTCVWRWQERFMNEGVDGLLRDKTRPSRIPPLTDRIVAQIVAVTLEPPPGEVTHWTAAAMAKVAGVSVSSVQRIWRKHGLQPHRIRQFKLSNDKQFAAKLHDVVGLYVDPPAHAVILSFDEKAQIQALDRTQPGLPLKPGRCGTMTHDYKRNGTTTLFAALNVLDGSVIGQCMQAPSPSGIHSLSQQNRGQGAGRKNHPRHPRQLRRSQAPEGHRVAGTPSALPSSTSHRHRHPGSMPSRASSPSSPSDDSNAASSRALSISRPPSTATSSSTTGRRSRSSGPRTPTKSSPPSSAGTNC
jgi:transposase